MKIDFERSGGFAGLLVKCKVDTDKLPPAERQKLIALVEGANLDARGAAKGKAGKNLPDSFVYKVKIEDKGSAFAGVLSDSDASDAEKELFRYLVDFARKG